MRNLLLVGAGGFLGASARYAVTLLLSPPASAARLPLGTLVVNVSGCLAIGILAGLGERGGLLAPDARLFLLTGILGGYTTYSAFALESFLLGREQAWVALAVNVAAHVVLGLGAVVIGFRLAAA